MSDWSKLKRKKEAMPVFIKTALSKSRLMEAYKKRPAYQQNDYLAWIKRGKQEVTKQKRLKQMLSELKKGGVYMNMKHKPSKK